METFLAEYVEADAEASEVVVKMWRHCLMHTAKPRVVKRAKAEYYWLLHWREHLPLEQHMRFTNSGETRILNIGLLYLLADFIAGCEKLLADFKADPASGKRAILVYDQLREQQL